MRGRQPNPRGESLTSQQKRVFLVVAGLLLVLLAGLGVWGATGHGRYDRSAHGCINVVEPSSTGGAILHQCGQSARALCRSAFSHTNRVALLTRPQCRLAGLAPSDR
jgi:hypothetical protein